MGSIFHYDSPLMRFLGKVADLLLLNLYLAILCLPIVTAGAALTAAHGVLIKTCRKETDSMTRDFFRMFRSNFKQVTKTWLVVLAMLVISFVSYRLCSLRETMVWNIIGGMLLISMVAQVLSLLWLFPILARFHTTVGAAIKNAVMFVVFYSPKTVAMAGFTFVPWLLMENYPAAIGAILPVCLSVPIWLSVSLYNKMFLELEQKALASEKETPVSSKK